MIMKQQGFNLRVLMSVALPFSLFLVAAVDGMEKGKEADEGRKAKAMALLAVTSRNDGNAYVDDTTRKYQEEKKKKDNNTDENTNK